MQSVRIDLKQLTKDLEYTKKKEEDQLLRIPISLTAYISVVLTFQVEDRLVPNYYYRR